MPKNPDTVEAIQKHFENEDILNTFGTTLHDDKYVFYDHCDQSAKFAYCIFSSKKTINLIKDKIPVDEREILMDATFKVVPKSPFNQLLVVYIRFQKKVSAHYHSLTVLQYHFLY